MSASSSGLRSETRAPDASFAENRSLTPSTPTSKPPSAAPVAAEAAMPLKASTSRAMGSADSLRRRIDTPGVASYTRPPPEAAPQRGPEDGMITKTRKEGKVTIVDIEGSINIGESESKFYNVLEKLINEGNKNILLNF